MVVFSKVCRIKTSVRLKYPPTDLFTLFNRLLAHIISSYRSYELSGWVDVHTLPPRRPRRSKQLPSAAGGPLIICLDTSHSMSGNREMLSKAVVVASVTAAIKQGRDCRVVSFSSASNSVECGNISCDASGINTLLDFLSYSFQRWNWCHGDSCACHGRIEE